LAEESVVTEREAIALIDRLTALSSETEWVEWKRNHVSPDDFGEYVSALANAACVRNERAAYLVFGIDNVTRKVVGTAFDPYAKKAVGNQDLLPWLAPQLSPSVRCEPTIVNHPKGRVVLFEISPARDTPVAFKGVPWIRVGSSKTKLARHPELERVIWQRSHDWSADTCPDATLDDLCPEAIRIARQQFAVKFPNQAAECAAWDDVTFLNKARVLRRGEITNTAILLLGKPESASLIAPAVARISWILRDGDGKEQDYEHIGPPFIRAGERLLAKLRNLVVRAMPDGTLFPREIPQYDPWVIREALHNCIAHQDYAVRARITVVEAPGRLLFVNAGTFIPGDVETVIRQDAPQARYRNPFLADAMVQLNLIDTQGGGIKRMYELQKQRSFPLPDYDLTRQNEVRVSVAGQVMDERYSRLLMARTDLPIADVMLLDRIQKKQPIAREEHRRLRAEGLVEGRYPNLIVAGPVARATGGAGRHIREKGLTKQYYVDLVLALLQEHSPCDRQMIDDLLIPKLPDRLSPEQKLTRVKNLLQEMKSDGMIRNDGSRSRPAWKLVESP
jgi:ATP-dependent DNA helicase RecG